MKKPEVTIAMRRFRVALRSRETGEECQVYLTVDKDKLRAAQSVGESSKELIERIAARNGYELLNIIGKPDKLSVTIPLDELWRRATEEQEERAKWNCLYGSGEAEVVG